MKRNLILLLAAIVSVTACKKDDLKVKKSMGAPVVDEATTVQKAGRAAGKTGTAARAVGVYTTYTIATGFHTCDQTRLQWVSLSEMNFAVKFDSSAIYTTASSSNQNDINMLYGFSEGFDHKYNSGRIGWNYSSGSLKLYTYTYRKGVVSYKLITAAAIGSEITCQIKLAGNMYICTANGVSVTTPRVPLGYATSGYQLYPYFGGTETAPHAVRIMIKDL